MVMDKGWFWVALAVLGVIAVPARSPTRAPSAAPPSSATSTPAPEQRPKEAPSATPVAAKALESGPLPADRAVVRTLQAELGLDAADPNAATGTLVAAAEARGYELAVLLVSVPDPRNGHMSVYFDQAMDALRRGASAIGLVQGPYSIPWSKPRGERQRAGGGPSAEAPSTAWLTFRDGVGKQKRLLIALLVPESPVLGPSRSELRAAITLADRLQARDPLNVLGPFFSGSAEPLNLEIEGAAPSRRTRIFTGTASGASVGARVTGGNPSASFHRTIPNDTELVDFVVRHLMNPGGSGDRSATTSSDAPPPRPRIGFLSEFDTVFGASLCGRSASAGQGQGGKSPATLAKVSCYGFPSSISQLRVTRLRREKGSDEGAVMRLRRTLELKLDPEEESLMDAPEATSELTPYHQELTLGHEFLRICRDRIDYLVISATDPVDVVFLAQESRKYCPGLALVTLGADKLFLHPDLGTTLDGMFVASSHPLLFALPPWRDWHQTQPFASHVAQGFFNAFVAWAKESRLTTTDALRDYGALALLPACQGPRMWMSAVAGGEFWPLSVECASAGVNGEVFVRPSTNTPARPQGRPAERARWGEARGTGLANAAGLVVLLLALLHAGTAAFAKLWPMRLPSLLRSTSLARRPLLDRYRIGAHASIGLLALLLLPAGYHVANRDDAAFLFRLWISSGVGLGAVAAAFLVSLSLYESVRLIKRLFLDPEWRAKGSYVRATTVAFCSVVAGFTVLSAAWAARAWTLPDLDRQLLLTRILDPLGMSPAAPLVYLALGFYAWSLIGLRRVHVLERVSESAPLSEDVSAEAPRGKKAHRSSFGAVLGGLRGFWSGAFWQYEIAASALFVTPGLYFWVRVLPTFEGTYYDCLVRSAVVVLYLAVGVALVHLVLLARELRAFLHQLAAHPMVDAYDRIAKKVAGSFGIELLARIPSFEELRVSSYSCSLLATLSSEKFVRPAITQPYRDVFEAAQPSLEACARRVERALEDVGSNTPDPSAVEREGHDALFATARELFVVLRKLWRARTESPVPDKYGAGLELKQLLPGGSHSDIPTVALYMGGVPENLFVWIRMAEDFVALRIATFVAHVIFHLRNLLTFALLGGLLLVLAVTSYPLHPQRFVMIFAWGLVFATVGVGLLLILRLRRNEILSRLSGSTPGRIDFDLSLVTQLVVYVGLPLLAVLSNMFPELRDLLFSWLEPFHQLLP